MQHSAGETDGLPPRLGEFVRAMTALVERGAAEVDIVPQGGALLRALVACDDWLPPHMAQPHERHYQQYLLYRDPAARFSVLSFVWGPGQQTPVHDHTVWGLIGILRGAELNQPYRIGADGALRPDGPLQRMEAGQVSAVSPVLGDIHQVCNAHADRVSIGVHVYGADIGAVDRSVYSLDGVAQPFRSGYANAK